MLVWIVLTVMIAVACAALAVALVRRQDEPPARLGDTDALRLQLADIEGQAKAGALPRETAEGLRAETIRRYLAESPEPVKSARPLSRTALSALAVAIAAVVALGASLLYAKLGRPDLVNPVAAQLAAGHGRNPDDPTVQLAGMIAQLEAKNRRTPDDLTTLKMLGAAYMQAGRYGDSAAAYGRAAALAPRDAESLSAEGEALVKAADGAVTPPAKAAFEAALADDPADPRARYFLGAYKDQQGDHAGAMADWVALLKSAPAGAPWAPQVRALVEQIAAQRDQDISSQLPAAHAAEPPDLEAQKAMIAGMVDRLAARLKADPKNREGWVNLMRARMVLGQPTEARQAYRDALAAFASSPADQAQLTAAARRMGVVP